MRELTSFEIQNISGAGFFDFIGAVVVGAASGITSFGMKWAMSGGSTGGILGMGIISGGVGFIIGAGVGFINGVLYGALNGWDTTASWFNTIIENTFDPKASVITA